MCNSSFLVPLPTVLLPPPTPSTLYRSMCWGIFSGVPASPPGWVITSATIDGSAGRSGASVHLHAFFFFLTNTVAPLLDRISHDLSGESPPEKPCDHSVGSSFLDHQRVTTTCGQWAPDIISFRPQTSGIAEITYSVAHRHS